MAEDVKRITVYMPNELYDRVLALATGHRRSVSAQVTVMIEDWVKFFDGTVDVLEGVVQQPIKLGGR